MKSVWQNLHSILKDKNPALIGAGVGLSLALALVIFGFWKTLFILGLTAGGYYLGNWLFQILMTSGICWIKFYHRGNSGRRIVQP